ncbi:MAG: DUF5053 domain-containing protein [Bacteroides sp.]|nr:DUF5053 domain-containing protein [Bacteroides sp.]
MNTVEQKIAELKNYIGKTDAVSRERFDEIVAYLESHDSPEVQEQLKALLSNGLKETQAEVESLKEKFQEEYEILPLAYIAKNYFNKSRAWLYQRLNGYKVRGQVYTLNDREKDIFNAAIQDIAQKIGSVHIS